MTPKRLILALVITLLVPVAASAAGPSDPSAAPAVPLPWLDAKATCAQTGVMATPADPAGAQAPAALPDSPFAQREEKGGICLPGSCDQYCADACCGVPYGQCVMGPSGICHSPCWCYC